MPAKKVMKRKTASVKKAARKPVAAKRRKAPEKLTYGATLKFLRRMELWWGALRVDVTKLQKLVRTLPPGMPLPPVAKQKFTALRKQIGRHARCSPIPKQGPRGVR